MVLGRQKMTVEVFFHPYCLARSNEAAFRCAAKPGVCTPCNARRLYYRLFGVPPLSRMAALAPPAHSKKTAALIPTKNVV